MTPRDGIKATGERPGEQAGSTCPGAMQRSAAAATGTGFEMRGWRPWRRPGPLSPARPCPSLPVPARASQMDTSYPTQYFQDEYRKAQ